MQYRPAKTLAVEICYKMQPYCDKINIAGSLRRKKDEVGDIEIICDPSLIEIPNGELFNGGPQLFQRMPEFISLCNQLGHVIKGKPDGKMMQIELPERIMVDLFMPESIDYYRQYAIRTGSSEYSHTVIATGWIKKGWCGSDKGLRRQDDCERIKMPGGVNKWNCINPNAELPPVWESEEHFFHWLGVQWIEPKLRNK